MMVTRTWIPVSVRSSEKHLSNICNSCCARRYRHMTSTPASSMFVHRLDIESLHPFISSTYRVILSNMFSGGMGHSCQKGAVAIYPLQEHGERRHGFRG